ncbi:MAG: hypothetical protein ACRDFB_00280, partial [Rhabdochlamydiaceae bacterium]
MTSAIIRTLKVWQPAVVSNLQRFMQKKKWVNKNPIDATTIKLRTAAFFAAALPLTLHACRNLNQPSLISRITYLELRAQMGQDPISNMFAIFVLLASLPLKLSLPLVSSVVSTYLFYRYEISRARSTIYAWITNQLSTNTTFGDELISYAAQIPSAVKALINSKNPPILLDKVPLLLQETILCDNFRSFQLIIDYFSSQKQKVSKKEFYQMLEHKNPDFTIYALSKKVISVSDFNNDDIVHCWGLVKNQQTAEALIEHEFSINMINDKGQSALLQIVTQLCNPNDFSLPLSKFDLLVKLGAYLDNLNINLTIKIEESNVTKSLEEWLKEKPKIWKALQQAQNPGKTEVKNFTSSLFAFLKPAITMTQGKFDVESSDIGFRTGMIALVVAPIMTALVATQLKTTFFKGMAIVGSFSLLMAKLYHQYAWRVATRELNSTAIDEFSNYRFHRSSVTKYICKYPDAMEAFIKKEQQFSKQDDSEKTVWESLLPTKFDSRPNASFLSFTKLANVLFPTLSPQEKLAHFILALETKKEKYARYILDKKLF